MPPGSTVTGVIGRFPSIDFSPVVECGRYPVKAVVGETIAVSVTAFREGHDAMSVEVQFVPPGFAEVDFAIGEPDGPLLRMHEVGPTQPDRWTVDAQLDREGDWNYYIITAGDPYESWKHKAEIKLPAGIDVELELEEGARVLDRAADQAGATHARKVLTVAAAAMRDTAETAEQRLYAAEAPAVQAALSQFPLRELPHMSGPWPVRVDRTRALYGAWYEFFPRSEGATLNPGALGHLPHCFETTRGRGRHGLRRGVPTADPPDRPHLPQGSEQHLDPRPRRSGLAVGDRLRVGRA